MPKLSFIVPSIRTEKLENLYASIRGSCPNNIFEMIVISPHQSLWSLKSLISHNIKWINSFRSPNAAQQEGLLMATGEYVCAAADDGIFLPGALDHAFNTLIFSTESDFVDYKTIIVGKYLEGDTPNPDMAKDDYYRFGYHKAYRLKGVPQDALIFNCGIISRKFMLELGGYDAQNFECTTIAHADLSIRAHKAGAKMILMDDVLFKCSHEPKQTGTHGPIHRAQTRRDEPTFRKIYAKENNRITIPLNNWEKTPEIWKERFK